jgi:Glycosyl transferase family 2
MRFGVCAIVRDELHHILEWLAFHSLMGAERFWLAVNDPEAEPMQKRLAVPIASGIVHVRLMPGDAQQLAAYAWGIESARDAGCEWVAFIDADEFLIPQVHADLARTLEEYEAYAGVVVNWVQFAAKDIERRPESVLASNVWRLPLENPSNQHVKLIARPGDLDAFRDPHSAAFRRGRFAVTQHGEPVRGPMAPITGTRVRLHHYFLRSREDFEAKIRRGRADLPMRTDGQFHRSWVEWDTVTAGATEHDESAVRYVPAVQALVRRWHAGDPSSPQTSAS